VQKINGILYGAFDARDNDVSPIFDLSPFGAIIDWMAAVRISRPIEGVSVVHEIANQMSGVSDDIRKYSPALVPVLGKIGEIERFSPEVASNSKK
jgi:hypothetical protein